MFAHTVFCVYYYLLLRVCFGFDHNRASYTYLRSNNLAESGLHVLLPMFFGGNNTPLNPIPCESTPVTDNSMIMCTQQKLFRKRALFPPQTASSPQKPLLYKKLQRCPRS